MRKLLNWLFSYYGPEHQFWNRMGRCNCANQKCVKDRI